MSLITDAAGGNSTPDTILTFSMCHPQSNAAGGCLPFLQFPRQCQGAWMGTTLSDVQVLCLRFDAIFRCVITPRLPEGGKDHFSSFYPNYLQLYSSCRSKYCHSVRSSLQRERCGAYSVFQTHSSSCAADGRARGS